MSSEPRTPSTPSAPRASEERTAYLAALCRTVPFHVVEAVLRDPSERALEHRALEGTALVADLVGFTALSERLAESGQDGLSRLSAVLNQLFEGLIEDAIIPYEGYVAHFSGDAVTAFFRGDGHAHRAAAAALAAERLMHGESGRLLGGRSRELMLRIGVASGALSLNVLGDLARRAAAVGGAAARRAQQLQVLAAPNTVLIDQSTLALIRGMAEVVDRHEDRATLRGLREWPLTSQPLDLGPLVAEQVEDKIALLEPFVPQPLALRLRTTPKGWRIEGELRNVVVLFTEIWREDGAESDLELGAQVSRSVLRAFRRYDGVVSKLDVSDRGHRGMVLFGIHRPSENDHERAVLAALEASARVRSFVSSRAIEMRIRSGLHAGRVFFGAIGSDLKHDITVIGDTVNVAARCMAAAEAFEVLATDSVVASLHAELRITERGPIRVKGKSEPLRMHVVHGPAEGRSHFVRSRSRQRFVAGREQEGRRLESIVDTALSGRGLVGAICGVGGTGKSFMLANVIDRWTRAGGQGVLGRCRFATKALPLAPVVTMFENFLGITSQDSEVERRDRIRVGLAPFELPGGAPELVALLQPVRRPDGSTEALVDLADSHAQERVLASITRFLERRVRQEPMLYVCEDMQYADTLTLKLATRLATLGREWPFLFLGTFRPDPLLDDLRRSLDVEVPLAGLSLAEVTELVCHERQALRVDPELVLFLWQRSAGNPGDLVELLRFLGDRGLLTTRAGEVVSQPGLNELRDIVPESIAHVALASLNDLGEIERRVLRVASAIGRRFDREVIESVARGGLEPDMLDGAMITLESQRIITPDQLEATRSYMFRDDVTRAVAYGTIPETERREVHRRIADAIERLAPEQAKAAAAVIAFHRERAFQLGAAAAAYERAARSAMRASLDGEGAVLVEAWLRVVQQMPEGERPALREQAGMAMLRLVATARHGAPAQTVELARDLGTRFAEALDEGAQAVLDYWLGDALAAMGKPEKARERLERVYARPGRESMRCDAARQLALLHAHALEWLEALRWIEQAEVLARNDGYRTARIALAHGLVLASSGSLGRAREIFLAVRDAAKRRDHVLLHANAQSGLARCELLACDFDNACRGFERAVGLARAAGRWASEVAELGNLGEALAWAGRFDEAKRPLEQAMIVARELGDEQTAAAATVHLALAVGLAGDPDEGRRLVDDGYRRAIRAGLRGVEIAADLHALRMARTFGDEQALQAAAMRVGSHSALIRTPLLERAREQLLGGAAP